MSYAKALKKLEKLPPGERQLAAGQYVWEVKKGKSHCGCAIGKLLTERQRVRLFRHKGDEGDSNNSGVEALVTFFGGDVAALSGEDLIVVADLTFNEAVTLQGENDSFSTGWSGSEAYKARNTYATRKARYKHIVAWLKEQIAKPPVPQAGGFDTAEF